MKPNHPEHDQQLEELAAGLDAGWDTPVPAQTQTSSSQPPLSIPPSGEALDALDADWDVDTSDSAPAPAAAKPRASRQRPSQQRPSLAHPGTAPLKVTKQERREAERKRQAHQAQQKSAAKLQRKAERQEEARRASEERRAEQQALAARQSSSPSPKRPAISKSSSESSTSSPKRIAKQARKQTARLAPSEAPAKVAPPVVLDRGAKKLIPIVAIAVVVGATLCFALLRAH
ncbi:MAG TPA: hypothetical protein VGF76_15270 [Polyangiaceae bacterium]